MDIGCKKGEHVILTDNCSQSFFGVIKSINQNLGRVVLSDVIQLPEHKIITGYRHFDKNEIKELKKYDKNKIRDEIEEAEEAEIITKLDATLSDSRISETIKVQSEYCYIKKFGSEFNSSIQLLKSCKKVGLLAMDTSKGRCSRASVVALATLSNVFIFDLQSLHDEVFDKGLREILESSHITKIVHDGRQLSDCLRHKHLVTLNGVRDVEAEDIMVVYQQRKMIRKHNRSLVYLVNVYLGVDIGNLDSNVQWNERPLSSDALNDLVTLVAYLIPLQEAIQQKYLQKLIDASDIYNSYVRNLDFFDFLHNDPTKTLQKQLMKLSVRETQARAECRKQRSEFKENDEP